MVELRNYQVRAINQLYDAIRQGNRRLLWVLPTGAGKCLGYGTEVIMLDGSKKPVQDIVIGDKLMGIDSTKREVISTTKGYSQMYEVIPTKGDSFTCNSEHMLSLVCNSRNSRYKYGEVVNIKITDYINLPKSVKHVLKLYKTSVEFDSKPVLLDPYFLGLWLGDGSSNNTAITTMDDEVVDFISGYAKKLNLNVTVQWKGTKNKAKTYSIVKSRGTIGFRIQNVINYYGLKNDKHIPCDYKYNSRDIRLKVLAGIIDSDGHLSKGYYEVVTKCEKLRDDYIYLSRSLGFQVNVSTKFSEKYNKSYHRLSICGNIDEIPTLIKRKKAPARRQIKNTLHTGFEVNEIGKGDYYGFTLSGNDSLFLLGDFTVTHNSSIAAYFVRKCTEKEKRVLFFVHSTELVEQFADRLRNQFHVLSGIIMAGAKQDRTKLVQVASVQTLARREVPDADVVIIDESHRSQANTYKKIIECYPKAVIVGLTATPYRGDGKGLGDLFETIVHPVKIRELIELGYLVGTKVYVPKEHVDMTGVKTVAGDYDKKEMSKRFQDIGIVKGCVDNYIKYANGKRAIVFNCSVEHSKEVDEMFRRAGVPSAHLDGGTEKDERKRIVNGFREGRILVLNNCFLFTEGFDVPACDAVILNRATKSEGLFVQMVGRGLRPAEGKEHCTVIDHSDNTMRFGFVEDYDLMQFSLEDRKKKKEGNEIPKTKQCKSCLSLVPFFQRTCSCGYEFQRKEKKITFGDEQEFVVLERDAVIVERLQRLSYGKAKNLPLSQLRLYALLHKYKKGWWFHKAIDEHGLPIIKEHPDAFRQVSFHLQLAEIQDGVHDLYNTLKKAANV